MSNTPLERQTTEAVVAGIRSYAPGYAQIVAASFTHFHGRTATSQGFKQAIKLGLIERTGTGGANNPIYTRTEVA